MTTELPAPTLPGWLETMLHFRRYTVEVDGRRWHVMEDGPKDGVPVLLVHGNPTWGFLYRKVALSVRALAPDTFRLIMPDLQGLGFSARPKFDEHTLENHASWTAALIEALDLKSAWLVVQDWGGPIGILGLSRSPAEIDGMVVLNTVIGPPRPGFKPTAFHRFSRFPIVSDIVFRGLQFPQSTMNIAQGDRRSIRGLSRAAYLYPLLTRGNAAPLAMARMVPDSQAHPSITALQECQEAFDSFDGPLRFVWGGRDPILGSVIRFLRKLKPDAPVTMTQAGHFLQEEVPDLIAEALVQAAQSK